MGSRVDNIFNFKQISTDANRILPAIHYSVPGLPRCARKGRHTIASACRRNLQVANQNLQGFSLTFSTQGSLFHTLVHCGAAIRQQFYV